MSSGQFSQFIKSCHKLIADSFCSRYGDKAPKSIVARIFSIFWILLGLIIMAIFMANITSALTALSLQLEPPDLAGVKVCIIPVFHICYNRLKQGRTLSIKNTTKMESNYYIHQLTHLHIYFCISC